MEKLRYLPKRVLTVEFPGMAFPLTTYIEAAMESATYDKLEDGSFAGEINILPGVAAFGASLKSCDQELRSVLEDWLLLGLRLGHKIPKVAGIDLNVRSNGRIAPRQKT